MLTVMTPTYNRAHTLTNCYQSLCGQTDGRFLWMIIDDGSTDDTEELAAGWRAENRIRIAYRKKENGGKASALNAAIGGLRTKYAVCLDSDDVFYPNTVELALKELEQADADSGSCGILALRSHPDGSVMGGREIPRGMDKVTAADIFLKLCLKTELICFYKTDILKQYRFPEFPGEKFVSPAWMQYEVTQKYHFDTSRSRLCRCEYMADGLTRNKRNVIAKNPRGYTCVKRYSFDLSPTLKLKIKHGIMYDCGCILSDDRDWLRNAPHKAWAVLLYPAARIVVWKRFREVI